MIQIERVDVGKYEIVSIGKEKHTIAAVDTLEKATCVLRFMSGASIKGLEYQLAIDTIREIDAEEQRTEGSDGTERVSREINNGVSDGSPSD